MDKHEKSVKSNSWVLLAVLGGLCVLIVVLILVVVMNMKKEEVGDIQKMMDDSTRAVNLSETISEKLNTEADYNPDQALEEYAGVYSEVSGSYKMYVAIQYADYACNGLGDCNLALEVMEGVQPGEDWSEFSNYYYELIGIYEAMGEEEKAQECMEVLNSKAEEGAENVAE